MLSRVFERLLLVLILIAALAVRLYGLGFSLPLTSNPDEPNIVDHAVATLKTGDWNPHWFIYPSGYHYLQTGVMTLHLLWGIARGIYASAADLPDSTAIITTAPEAYLWARGTTALFGVLSVFLVWLVGRRLFSPPAGLAGALLLALSPLHVEHSRYVTTDVPMAALCLLSVYLALKVLEHGGGGRAFLGGLVVGVAGGFKYNAVVAVLPLLLAIAMRQVRLSPLRARSKEPPSLLRALSRFFSRELALALLGIVLGFLLACPYALGDLPTFLDDLGYETHIYRFGGEQGIIRTYEVNGVLLPPWLAYAHVLWEDSPGAALAGLGGLIFVLSRRRKSELVLLSFIAAYYLFLCSYGTIFARNVIPAMPGLAVLGGGFLALGVQWLGERRLWRQKLARFAPLLLSTVLVAIVAGPTRGILGAAQFLATPTSEVQARAWLDAHLSPEDKVAAELHPLLFTHSPYHVTSVKFLSNYPLQALVNRGYDYVVVNSERYGTEFAREDTFPDYYLNLLNRLERVPDGDFPGHTRKLPGPRLTIFRVPEGPPQAAHPLDITAGPGLRFLGYDVGRRAGEGDLTYVRDTSTLNPGDTLALTLYLQARATLPEDYLVSLRLRDAAGRVVAAQDLPPCNGACPPTTWAVGTIVMDEKDLPLPPSLAPGRYRLEVRFLRPDGKEALPLSPGDFPEGTFPLTTIELVEKAP